MNDDVEMADVMVVLSEESGVKMAQAIELLTAAGLSVSGTDPDNCVIEGTVEHAKISSLRAMAFVKYVRDVFDYVSDRTPEAREEDTEDVDDAGR